MKIALDFDGTCVSNKFPLIGETAPYCVTVLNGLVKAGHTLILNTVRSDKHDVSTDNPDIVNESGKYLSDAINWFSKHGIQIKLLEEAMQEQSSWTDSSKLYADMYIDDRNLMIPYDVDRGHVDWLALYAYFMKNGEINIDDITTLSWLSYNNAKDKGFHDKERDPLVVHALICSEIGEATEAVRNNEPEFYYDETGKPCGEASEIADIIIRCLDYCIERDWDVEKILRLKTAYNLTRPRMHNKQV